MGFYPPASLVRDAQRRGVEVLPPDVNLSEAWCSLTAAAEDACGESTQRAQAVRIGLAYVQSVGEDDAAALVAEREANGPYRGRRRPRAARCRSRRTASSRSSRGARATASGPREPAPRPPLGARPRRCGPRPCRARRGEAKQLTLPLDPTAATPELRELTPWERMAADYRLTGLSVGIHPLTLLRPHLPEGTLRATTLHRRGHGPTVAYAGLAIARQRPSTANGIVFMLLEDEHGQVNLIVPQAVYERHRAIVRSEPLLLARGRYERVGGNRNILVSSIETLGALARRVAELDVGAALPRAHHFGHR